MLRCSATPSFTSTTWRSPGTLNILTLIHICTTQKIPFLYLGYWIDGLTAMSYKSALRPYELLQDGESREVGR